MYHSWLVIQFDILSKRVRDENFEYFQTFSRFFARRTVYRPQPPRTFNFFAPLNPRMGVPFLASVLHSFSRSVHPFRLSLWAKKISYSTRTSISTDRIYFPLCRRLGVFVSPLPSCPFFSERILLFHCSPRPPSHLVHRKRLLPQNDRLAPFAEKTCSIFTWFFELPPW